VQVGIGLAAVADWWLGMVFSEVEETVAAAPPAMTMARAIMRIASFMIGNLLLI
jgi:hypothetical protein